MSHDDKINLLQEFKRHLLEYSLSAANGNQLTQISSRQYVNTNKPRVRSIIREAGVYKSLTIGPPPAVGGLLMRNVDPLDIIFNPPYQRSPIPVIVDMIDEAIGAIMDGALDRVVRNEPVIKSEIQEKTAFIAMSISKDDKELEDVLDSIKEAAKQCGVDAFRIDEEESSERITDRIFEAIRVCEFVIVDVTGAKPNVFYEAGYSHGIGKIPIFLAKHGTRVEFDIKDYPIIFYRNMRELKEGLKRRLVAVSNSTPPE
jgi:hypothetical protein